MRRVHTHTIHNVYYVLTTGKSLVLSGVGGMTNNVRVSDPACGWEADGEIIPKIVKNANIASMLKLRADI